MALVLDGRTFFVPGVYAITKIINLGGQALPPFNVGVIIGKQMKGKPYTLGTGASPIPANEFILPHYNEADLIEQYGDESDSEITTFFKYGKKQGLGLTYILGVNPYTNMKDGVIQNGSAIDAIKIAHRDYGAHSNDVSVTIAVSIHTVIPPKNITYLTANSGTGKTISVKNVKPYKVGDTVFLVDNAYALPVSKVIESIDASAKTITFTAVIAASALVAQYARIFQEDTVNQEISGTLDTPAKVLSFYGGSKYLSATIFAAVTLMPVTLAKTYTGNLTGATKGASPDATATDWQNIADNFQRWNEEFALANKVYLRVLGLVTSDTANHAAFVTLANTLRSKNKPIAIVAGAALGDYALATSNPGNPATRAASLNTDDFQLAGFGLDGLAPSLSLAGEMFGIRLSNAINHNQTRDVVIATSVEKAYFRDDPALETWIKAGVISILMEKPAIGTTGTGWWVAQGLTTYQDQSSTFNTSSKRTYLVMLRDLADFDLRATLEVLNALVGEDGVTQQSVATALVQSGDTMVSSGYVLSYKITKITKTGNTFTVEREVALDSPTDFIGLVNTIVVS